MEARLTCSFVFAKAVIEISYTREVVLYCPEEQLHKDHCNSSRNTRCKVSKLLSNRWKLHNNLVWRQRQVFHRLRQYIRIPFLKPFTYDYKMIWITSIGLLIRTNPNSFKIKQLLRKLVYDTNLSILEMRIKSSFFFNAMNSKNVKYNSHVNWPTKLIISLSLKLIYKTLLMINN